MAPRSVHPRVRARGRLLVSVVRAGPGDFTVLGHPGPARGGASRRPRARLGRGAPTAATRGGRRPGGCGRDMNRPQGPGLAARGSGVAMGMTQQYLAGELSVLLSHVQAVTTTEAARCAAWSLAARGRDRAGPGTARGDRARTGTDRRLVLGVAEPWRHGGVHPAGGGVC